MGISYGIDNLWANGNMPILEQNRVRYG